MNLKWICHGTMFILGNCVHRRKKHTLLKRTFSRKEKASSDRIHPMAAWNFQGGAVWINWNLMKKELKRWLEWKFQSWSTKDCSEPSKKPQWLQKYVTAIVQIGIFYPLSKYFEYATNKIFVNRNIFPEDKKIFLIKIFLLIFSFGQSKWRTALGIYILKLIQLSISMLIYLKAWRLNPDTHSKKTWKEVTSKM